MDKENEQTKVPKSGSARDSKKDKKRRGPQKSKRKRGSAPKKHVSESCSSQNESDACPSEDPSDPNSSLEGDSDARGNHPKKRGKMRAPPKEIPIASLDFKQMFVGFSGGI